MDARICAARLTNAAEVARAAVRASPTPAAFISRFAHLSRQRYFPVPVSGIVWFAFAALSKIVTVLASGPFDFGANCSVSVQCAVGARVAWQVVAFFFGNANDGKSVTVASGLPKVMV
jgi:hypothetical protein